MVQMTRKVMISVILISLNLLMLNGIANGSECEGPTDKVKVTVKQLSESPRVYSYTIRNLSKFAIKSFTLGIGEKREMLVLPENTPISVGSPDGWEGFYVYPEQENILTMHIFWGSKDKRLDIKPGESKEGFIVVMPEIKRDKIIGPSSEIIKPLDMKNAPFDLRFSNFKCVWGRVVEE